MATATAARVVEAEVCRTVRPCYVAYVAALATSNGDTRDDSVLGFIGACCKVSTGATIVRKQLMVVLVVPVDEVWSRIGASGSAIGIRRMPSA